MPSKEDCGKMSNARLVEMCKAKGIRGYSGKGKEWLVENCCVFPARLTVPLPRTIAQITAESRQKEVTSQVADRRAEKARKAEERKTSYDEKMERFWEEKRRERDAERREQEERAEREHRMEQERLDAFNAEIRGIKPVGNVKSPSMYNKKNVEWQTEVVANLGKESIAGPNPVYTGYSAFNFCPESMGVLVQIIEDGYLHNKMYDDKFDRTLARISIGGLPGSSGMVDRRVDPPMEVLVMDDQRVGIERMQKALKSRFRPYGILSGSRCFEVEKSASGRYYGVFLKK